MRLQLHGSDSSLRLLREEDRDFKEVLVITSHFTVTRQRDTVNGGYIDKLTIKALSPAQRASAKKFDAIDLTVGSNTTRYRTSNRSDTPQGEATFIFADLAMMRNERTAIVDA